MENHTATDLASTYFTESNVTQSSVKQYRANLARWFRLTGVDDAVAILSNPKKYVKLIDELFRTGDISHSTKKLMVATMCALYKHYPMYEEQYKHAREIWTETLKACNKKQFEAVAHLEPTKAQAENWVDWSDIQRHERFLNSTEYGSDMHLILACYTLMEPMRADLGQVAIAIDKRTAKRLNSDKKNFIHLSSKPNKSYLVLNSYKTIKTYGRYFRYVPDELVRIIAHSLERNPRAFLFVNRQNEPYATREAFRIRLNKDLARMFQKNVTVMILRHSFISSIDFNTTPPAKLFEISHNMMHSIGTQQLYRRSVVQPTFQIALDNGESTSGQPVPVTASYAPSPSSPSSQPSQQPFVSTQTRSSHSDRKKKRKKKRVPSSSDGVRATPVPVPRYSGRIVTI